MQSSGGIMSADVAASRPSTPSTPDRPGGVTAAAQLGVVAWLSRRHLLRHGRHHGQGLRGSGRQARGHQPLLVGGRYFIGVPVMDMVEIGAGGGSIASVDEGGAVHVGPRSAGSVPGPACYAQGRERADRDRRRPGAGLHQRRLLPGRRHDGRRRGGRAAIKEKIADRLGMGVPEAAHGIYRLVNANMIGATRVITVQRGHDPRDFSLVVSGGTAAIHAVRMAQELRIPRVIIPLNAGVFSAVGLITADARYDVHRSYVARGSQADPAGWRPSSARSPGRRWRRSRSLGSRAEEIVVRYEIDMRYLGQAHEVPVEVPAELTRGDGRADVGTLGGPVPREAPAICSGTASPTAEVEFMTSDRDRHRAHGAGRRCWRSRQAPPTRPLRSRGRGRSTSRRREATSIATPTSGPGSRRATSIAGPAIVEQMDTTTVHAPGGDRDGGPVRAL